jgi:murein DD-endopeptidase MepM/ murein hydrolase activator NlpD
MKRTIRFATLLLATTVAACGGRLSGPAPFVQHDLAAGVTVATPLPQAAMMPPQSGPSVVVQPGDTVYRIAQRERVPQRALIDANGLQAPYIVQPGQVLRLPEQKIYVVQAGDTLSAISRRHGLDVATLARTNQLKPPYGVQTGQALTLPSPMQALGTAPPAAPAVIASPAMVVAAVSPAAAPARGRPLKDPPPLAVRAPSIPPPAADPVSNATVTAAPRSTVQAAVLEAPVQSAPLKAPAPALQVAAAPTLTPTPTPSTPEGQFLRLPDPKPVVPAPGPVAVPSAPEPRPVAEAKPAAQAAPAAEPVLAASPPSGQFLRLPDPKPAPSPAADAVPAVLPSNPPVSVARAAEPKPTPIARAQPAVAEAPSAKATPVSVPAPMPRTATEAPPPRSGRHFLWPVKGRVLASYGPQPGGLHNDGLNIAANRGASVMAAENGVVAYAGADLKGFGNLLLVKHAGGFVTAYAHNDKLLVKRGDTVRRGQSIATVGESGSVTRPQVHFQVRQGAHAVDPRPLMDRRA